MSTQNIEQALEQYLDHIKQDYVGWNTNPTEIGARMRDEFINSVRVEQGRKYIKVIAGTSVHSFIVLKQDRKWGAGDILKAATWAAPATNFSRGNVFQPATYQNRVRWTGAL